MKQIILYQNENGDIPVKIFLNEILFKNLELHSKILQKIDLLSIDKLGTNDVKYLGDKIFELRIKQSTNISRIFYFTIKNDEIILLDGILKKTQKLEKSIIERVKKYKNNYLKNNLI